MIVKDLITELLEFDMDTDVIVRVDSSEENDDLDFEVSVYRFPGGKKEVQIDVDLEDYVLIAKEDLEDLRDRLNDLEDELSNLKED